MQLNFRMVCDSEVEPMLCFLLLDVYEDEVKARAIPK